MSKLATPQLVYDNGGSRLKHFGRVESPQPWTLYIDHSNY